MRYGALRNKAVDVDRNSSRFQLVDGVAERARCRALLIPAAVREHFSCDGCKDEKFSNDSCP
jgi:hypothetical protein